MGNADLERRVRELERQVLAAQLPSPTASMRGRDLERAFRGRSTKDTPASALLSMLVGFVLMAGGLLLLLSRVVVWSGFWFMGGQPPLVLLLVPFVVGVALTLVGGRALRYLGIVLSALSVVGIFGVSLSTLRLYFLPTPAFTVLGIVALMGLGLALAVRGAWRL